jgi:hypothetical protein
LTHSTCKEAWFGDSTLLDPKGPAFKVCRIQIGYVNLCAATARAFAHLYEDAGSGGSGGGGGGGGHRRRWYNAFSAEQTDGVIEPIVCFVDEDESDCDKRAASDTYPVHHISMSVIKNVPFEPAALEKKFDEFILYVVGAWLPLAAHTNDALNAVDP